MIKFDEETLGLAEDLVLNCNASALRIATAESCTGGLLAGAITAVSGASCVFTHGYVSYANEAKCEMLGVDAALIHAHGAVSEKVACAMAEGAMRVASSHIALSTTGIAGPTGGTEDKPVGLVHIACAREMFECAHEAHQFSGNRDEVRAQAVKAALTLALKSLV